MFIGWPPGSCSAASLSGQGSTFLDIAPPTLGKVLPYQPSIKTSAHGHRQIEQCNSSAEGPSFRVTLDCQCDNKNQPAQEYQ